MNSDSLERMTTAFVQFYFAEMFYFLCKISGNEKKDIFNDFSYCNKTLHESIQGGKSEVSHKRKKKYNKIFKHKFFTGTKSTTNWRFEKWLKNTLQINAIRCKN